MGRRSRRDNRNGRGSHQLSSAVWEDPVPSHREGVGTRLHAEQANVRHEGACGLDWGAKGMDTCALEHGQGIIIYLGTEELTKQEFGIIRWAWD